MIFAEAAAVHGVQSFHGAIFDVDGVLLDSPHFRAWRGALRELMDTEWAELLGRTSYSPDKFTEAVYQQVVAGRPRLAGALAALEYFGVPDAGRRAPLFAAVKQEHLVTLIEAGEFTAFDDAIRFALAAKAAGIPIAAASSSRNAGLLQRRAPALGVARLGDTEALVNAGADLAVRSLDEVSRRALAEGRLEGKTLERKVAT
jgi:beta-phosphoglucomutase-like phosphatase (HAD superfamily)